MSTQKPARPGVYPPQPQQLEDESPPAPATEGTPIRATPRLGWRRSSAAVSRYKWWVLLVCAVGTAGGAAASRFVEPRYESSVTVWIEGSEDSALDPLEPLGSSQLMEPQAWLDLATSSAVLDAVVHDLRLYLEIEPAADSLVFASFQINSRFQAGSYRIEVDRSAEGLKLSTASGALIQSGALGDSLGQGLGFGWAPPAEALAPGQTISFAVGDPRDAAKSLAQRIDTGLDRTGTFLRFSLRGTEPERVAAVLSAVASRYAELAAELKHAKLEQLVAIMNEQRREAVSRVDLEADLEKFRLGQAAHIPALVVPSASVRAGRDSASSRLVRLKTEQERLRRDREAIELVLGRIAAAGLELRALATINAVQRSHELVSALLQINETVRISFRISLKS